MPSSFNVKASTGEYSVEIGCDLPWADSIDSANSIIISDGFFSKFLAARGLKVIEITARETSKDLENMADVIVRLKNFGANRKTKLVAIGGGVIQDIATFVASLYMRGLKWQYLPTTLLGMVDSCIGGKSSINVGTYKNLVGNFYPPQSICVDLKFVETLNTEQRAAGLFEAVKICFASNGEEFQRYLNMAPKVSSDMHVMQDVVCLSLLTKRWFIETDEHDQRERLLLNFGHTFAHAIEGACNYAMPHGIAVGAGMLVAIDFARLTGIFHVVPSRVLQLQEYSESLLATVANVPCWINQTSDAALMDRFDSDKKHTTSHYVVILPDANGYLCRVELERSESVRQLLHTALRAILERLSESMPKDSNL